MNGRVLPNNLEAEQSVLGACFLSKYALQKAGENLSSESFYNDKNGKIFATMISLMEEHTPIDLTTVTSALKKKNDPFLKNITISNDLVKVTLIGTLLDRDGISAEIIPPPVAKIN